MAQPKDESNAQVLPDSELNPLVNPLLAAHMGRWAEVYFTSPPEKRAQAVSELVRELANNSTPGEVSTQSSNVESRHRSVDEAEEARTKASFADLEQPALVCGSCGHRNSVVQRFCGMCGSPLTSWSEDSSEGVVEEAQPQAAAAWDEPAARFPENISPQDAAPELGSSRDIGNRDLPDDAPPTFAEESRVPFEALSSYESAPVSNTYRVYVGVVLAILLSLLVYMTWRGNAAFWSNATAPSALPRTVPAPTEAGPAAAAEPRASKTPEPNPGGDASSAESVSPPPTQKQVSASVQKDRRETDRRENGRKERARPAPRVVPVTASSPTNAGEQNGSEELGMAEAYLNTSPGTARDSRQASSWLWKAVAKQNLTATLLLADLYLRGDGVTKSCDQARLLLDAAARKGATAAAQRLRNLQAFGCQ